MSCLSTGRGPPTPFLWVSERNYNCRAWTFAIDCRPQGASEWWCSRSWWLVARPTLGYLVWSLMAKLHCLTCDGHSAHSESEDWLPGGQRLILQHTCAYRTYCTEYNTCGRLPWCPAVVVGLVGVSLCATFHLPTLLLQLFGRLKTTLSGHQTRICIHDVSRFSIADSSGSPGFQLGAPLPCLAYIIGAIPLLVTNTLR